VERGRPLIIRVVIAVCIALGAAGRANAESRQLVLVSASNSPYSALSSLEVRMLFLGYVVQRQGQSLRPIRNLSDPLVNDIFLQHVVAMSGTAYDRRILIARLQKGRAPPDELATSAEVARRLRADPFAISYMWLDQVQFNPSVKILRVLWVEQ
jgi:hypothetical protein